MATPYTRRALIERVKRHVASGFPNDEFAISDNEILFLIDDAVAFAIKGMAFEHAKIEGVLAVPEAFQITFELDPLVQDTNTGYWYATLPQPPISLPLGYSINQCYFAGAQFGKSSNIMPLSAKRSAYREDLPMPRGTFYWVENDKIWVWATNNQPLSNMTVFVQMPSPRSESKDDVMNIPEDALTTIWASVTGELLKRYGIPDDVISDGLPAGKK